MPHHDPRADDLHVDGVGPDADEVDALLDEVLAERTHATTVAEPASGDSATLWALRRVRALAAEPVPPDVRGRHLLRIRTHGRTEAPAGVPADAPVVTGVPARRRRARVLVASLAAVLVAGGGSAVAVAQDAAPDDALYGVKRSSEQVWLGLPRGQERAADVHLALADRRMNEARRAPAHAARLIAEGVDNVEAAAEERPEEAVASFERLLGSGEDRLPDQASPVARAALHRNCVRLAERHELGTERCGPAPDVAHPGRGAGAMGDRAPGERPPAGRGTGRSGGEGPRGWGPGGRPEGVEGPPPGTPGHERAGTADDDA